MENKKTRPKAADIAVTAVFATIMLGLMLLHFALPDRELSKSERRYLAEFPEPSVKAVLDSEYSERFDEYMTDHFPFRDAFRSLKALSGMAVGRADNNGYILDDGRIYKTETKTDVKQIAYAAGHFDAVTEKYLDGYNVYYTVIPDKSFYNDLSYPKLDHTLLLQTVAENNERAQYIDITPCLDGSDYYDTDTHWRQERIVEVADALALGMGRERAEVDWQEREVGSFVGVYKAHSGFAAANDELKLLTSVHTDEAKVFDPVDGEYVAMYRTELIDGMDGYDVFLGGAVPLLTIENPNAASERELVIFRDSFGSSLVPLLTPYYSRIVVVDLRYIASSVLGDYVELSGEGDALFAFSTILLNTGRVLR